MLPFNYEVSLGVTHPEMKAEAISKELAPVPLKVRPASVGERRTTPSGRELDGVYSRTRCTVELGPAISSEQGVVESLTV